MNDLKDMQGCLFMNKDMRTDQSPSRKGYIVVRGERFWLSSWEKVAASGERYITLAAKEDNSTNEEN